MKLQLSRILLFTFLFLFGTSSYAEDFAANENMLSLLRNSGVGILIGAGLGTVVMATQDEPGQHSQDIAKGASLGLYTGLAYSYYAFTRGPVRQIGISSDLKLRDIDSSSVFPFIAFSKNESVLGFVRSF